MSPSRCDAEPEVTVVYPCYNEEAAIAQCVDAAFEAIEAAGYRGEVVVVDNNCTDRSPAIAEEHGARVVKEPRAGYGAAITRGLREAKGEYLVVLDADATYPIEMLEDFVQPMKEGRADFVLGNRFGGSMEDDAMPFLNRYVGNPVLSGMTRLFFRVELKDMHCGMRALRKSRLDDLQLRTPGMEFATEMVVKALDAGLRVHELTIPYRPRVGESKLMPLRDAWRHTEYMLVFSPTLLFLLPGLLLFGGGLMTQLVLASGPTDLWFRTWDHHTNLAGMAAALTGSTLFSFGVISAAYARSLGMRFRHSVVARLAGRLGEPFLRWTGIVLAAIGAVQWLGVILQWLLSGLGELAEVPTLARATTWLITGLLFVLAAFVVHLITLDERPELAPPEDRQGG